MRSRLSRAFLALPLGSLAGACAHVAPVAPPATAAAAAPVPAEPPATAPAAPEAASQYVVADPLRPTALTLVPLGEGAGTGMLLEGVRFLLSPSAQVRFARDAAPSALMAAWRVPARLGGGFLFRQGPALYASEAFTGLLRPVVSLPADVSRVSFGPHAVLVASDAGERWMIDVSSGRRVPVAPPGLLDIAALEDGRAAALVGGGGLLVSTDGGAHWADATARLSAPATGARVQPGADGAPDELWVETQGGPALRLMPGGRLAEFDAAPAPAASPTLRPGDPAWREDEAPIRYAVEVGVPLDERSALVVTKGDLVKVDLVTGAVDVVAPGRLPPEAQCVGTRTPDDAVFTCAPPKGGVFVVSHTGARAPVIERSFPDAARVFASDDGALAVLGRCDGASVWHPGVACVRSAAGEWREYEVEAPATADAADAGAAGAASTPGSPSVPAPAGNAGAGGARTPREYLRWVPRGDGDAVAVVTGLGGRDGWGWIDGRTGEAHPWPDAPPPPVQAALRAVPAGARVNGVDVTRLADRGWTLTARDALRGWTAAGGVGAVEVSADGAARASPYTFDRVSAAGVLALARTREGRIWQSVDRGDTWAEVAAPPVSHKTGALDAHACSPVGCDLGRWYRIGWAPAPPVVQPPPATAPPAPRVERSPAPTLACRVAGPSKRVQVARGDRSPDDLGLGAARVATSSPSGAVDFLRMAFARRISAPVRDNDPGDAVAPRAIVHGPSTHQAADGRLVVAGPNRDIFGLVRQLSFVPPFDPLGAVRRSSLAARDIAAAARAAGVSADDALSEDPTPSAVVPVTPVDAAAPGDVAVQLTGGAVALAFAGPGKARIAFEPARAEPWRLVSAAEIDADSAAWLEEDAEGHARVLRGGGGGGAPPAASIVLELAAPPSDALYPANVDALGIGPAGDLAVIRTPSGSEPPSALDPAVALAPGAPPAPLAPWSSLVPAEDPACRADPSGWRVTVQAIEPWVKLAGAGDLRGLEGAPMLARVRWSAARVCLEALEVRAVDATVPGGSSSQWGSAWDAPVESWVVARFAGGASAGRVVVVAGGEEHQALECRL